MENINGQQLIPKTLRQKNVDSRVSREIFFIDCINDLDYCAKTESSYNLIRSSVLLRMLLLDGGLETVSKNYNFSPNFSANTNELQGTPLNKSEVRAIKKTLEEFKTKVCSTDYLKLKFNPSKKYETETFKNKICLIIGGTKKYNFSVSNIIEVVANKHGAAHLESEFDSTSIESFHLAEFSPFSMTDGNFFLEKIKEIIEILVEAANPLTREILKHLNMYNNSINQEEVSEVFTIIRTREEFEKLNFGKK